MYAVKAIYDGVSFMPKQPISVKGRYEVVITFLKPLNDSVINIPQEKKRPRSEVIGLFEGKVWMADDFNAPIDELKEYM